MWPDRQKPIPIDKRLFDWQSMTADEVEEAYLKHGNKELIKTLKKLGMLQVIDYASRATITSSNNATFCNFQGGYGSTPFGGDTDFILEEILGSPIDRPKDFQNRVNIIHAAMTKAQAALLHLLAKIAPGDIDRFQLYNSGTEAVDNLLQAVWFAKGLGTIITMGNAYHGKSLGTRMATPESHFAKGLGNLELTIKGSFGKKQPLFVQVPYGDIDALTAAIKRYHPKAVLLEPVQGEAGGIRPPRGFLRRVEKLCHENDAYVLYDEVQVGLGRTGKLWGCQLDEDENWQPHPDGITAAKALGGGFTAVAAIGLTDQFWQQAYSGQDGMLRISTTFGGNVNACIAAICSIRRILEENLPQAAAEAGEYMLKKLESFKSHPLIKRISGAGLLIGIEFNVPLPGDQLAQATIIMIAKELLQREGIPVVSLARPVLRLEPPLVVSKEAIDQIINALAKVLELYPNKLAFTKAIGKTGIAALTA